MNYAAHTDNAKPQALPSWAVLVLQKVRSLQFGTIQVTVHDGRVTQVETTEKIRLRPEDKPNAAA